MRVEIAVGVVVDRAARRAHEQRAENEDHHDARRRAAVGREPDGPEGRPKQQQRADRLVEADETLIGVEAPCDEGEIHARRITQAAVAPLRLAQIFAPAEPALDVRPRSRWMALEHLPCRVYCLLDELAVALEVGEAQQRLAALPL